jgi:ribonuclease-3
VEHRIEPLSYLELEKNIGYVFRNKDFIITALTHSSYVNETKKANSRSNERLEFLGDSILSVIVSEYIYRSSPELDEGYLTRIRANIVCENSLSEFAKEIDLGSYLLMGRGEAVSNGRERKSTVADAFEALLAAIYLDGGMEQAKKFLLPRVKSALAKISKVGNEDYKSRLQKIVQQTPEELLEYILVSEEGPPHDRVFAFKVMLNSNCLGEGKGRTKREAEQNAAREALIVLGELDENPS